MQEPGTARMKTDTRLWLKLIVIYSLIILYGIHTQLAFFNGIPGIWEWNWRKTPLYSAYYLFVIPLMPFISGLYLAFYRRGSSNFLILGLFTASFFLLQYIGIYTESSDFSKIYNIVVSPYATSYYTDASLIDELAPWMASFHEQQLHLHSRTHPAGPIITHYLFIQLFGEASAPHFVSLATALLAASGIPVMWLFSSLFTGDRFEKLLATALYCMTPGLVLFFPEFDQVYPVIAMVMLYTWLRAVDGSHLHTIVSSLTLAVAVWFAYNLLVLGTFYVLYGLYRLSTNNYSRPQVWWLLKVCLFHLVIVSGIYAYVYFLSGYNAILAFSSALDHQSELSAILDRPHSIAIFYNLYDFFLGAGYLTFILLIFYITKHAANPDKFSRTLVLVLIGLITIIITNFSGLLNYETARVWLFMQPLVIIPSAMALAIFNREMVILVLSLQWLILATIKANMVFIGA